MPSLNKLPRVAAIIAFVIAGIIILAGLSGPIIVLPLAIIPLCAGIGILRKHVWSAYGFATYSFAQLLILPVLMFRRGYSTAVAHQIIVIFICSLSLGILFLSAGRVLAASGAARGRVFPWIVVSALSIVPFFFIQTFEVSGKTMEATLLPGDYILARTFRATFQIGAK
jgi:hypothetical protein